MDCPPEKWPLQRGLNKSQFMDCPPKKWPLLEVRLYLKQVSDHGHENKLKIIKCSVTFFNQFLSYFIDRNTYEIQDS